MLWRYIVREHVYGPVRLWSQTFLLIPVRICGDEVVKLDLLATVAQACSGHAVECYWVCCSWVYFGGYRVNRLMGKQQRQVPRLLQHPGSHRLSSCWIGGSLWPRGEALTWPLKTKERHCGVPSSVIRLLPAFGLVPLVR